MVAIKNSILSAVVCIVLLGVTAADKTRATATNDFNLRGTLVESLGGERIITYTTNKESKKRSGDKRAHHRELQVKCKEIEDKNEKQRCKKEAKARKAAKKAAKEARKAAKEARKAEKEAKKAEKEQEENNNDDSASGRTETKDEVEKEDIPLPDYTPPQDLVLPPDYTPPANKSKKLPKAGGANSQLARQYWTKMPPNDIWLQVSIPKKLGSTDDTCLPGSGTSPCPVAVENRDGIKSVTEYCENSHECETGCCMQIRLENAWTFSYVCLYHEATPWNTCVYGTTAPVEEESTAILGRSGNGKGEFEACEASSECASQCCFNYGGEMGIGCLKTDNPKAMGDLCIIGEVGVGGGTGGAIGGRSEDGNDGDSNTGSALGGSSSEDKPETSLKFDDESCSHSDECQSGCCADFVDRGLICVGIYYEESKCIHR